MDDNDEVQRKILAWTNLLVKFAFSSFQSLCLGARATQQHWIEMNREMAMKLQQSMQEEVNALREIQSKQNLLASNRHKLVTNLTECETVDAELTPLTDDDVVYKLIGPALVKQDVTEAQKNVKERLSYFRSELSVSPEG